MPEKLRIVEVGPRDGLQNEAVPIPLEAKLRLISALDKAGLAEIEATSFVSPRWVPQLADASILWSHLPLGPAYSALIPNMKGLEAAIQLNVRRIAVFTATTDSFTQHNTNMTRKESLEQCRQIIETFRDTGEKGWTRGYISTAFECPYEGPVSPEITVGIAKELLAFGVDEVSLGDTIGVAVPKEVRALTQLLKYVAPVEKLNYHFHDTRGTALANVFEAYEHGIRSFDASAGGLGGCPYAPGAGGNLATEDLVYAFERSGITTGINLNLLSEATLEVLALVGRQPSAKAQRSAIAAFETSPKQINLSRAQ